MPSVPPMVMPVSPQPDTSLHCKTTGIVHCTVCLFTPQLFLVVNALIHRRMARLSWLGPFRWLVTYRWSPIQVQTRHSAISMT